VINRSAGLPNALNSALFLKLRWPRAYHLVQTGYDENKLDAISRTISGARPNAQIALDR
jgi:hypothetical protein